MAKTGAERQAAWRERRRQRIAELEAAAREPDVDVARQALARHIADELVTPGSEAFVWEIRLLNRALRDEGASWRITDAGSGQFSAPPRSPSAQAAH